MILWKQHVGLFSKIMNVCSSKQSQYLHARLIWCLCVNIFKWWGLLWFRMGRGRKFSKEYRSRSSRRKIQFLIRTGWKVSGTYFKRKRKKTGVKHRVRHQTCGWHKFVFFHSATWRAFCFGWIASMNFSCALLNLSKIIIYLGIVSLESLWGSQIVVWIIHPQGDACREEHGNGEINLVLTKYLRREFTGMEERFDRMSQISSVQEAVDSISRFVDSEELPKA